jgi:hypothetical protein
MPGIKTAHHHGSHRRLIWLVDEPTPPVKVDAIIVPTARPVDSLQHAAAAALSLRCPLVTLHSRESSAYSAVRNIDPAIDLIAIDVPGPEHLQLPPLETSRLLEGTIFERRTDVSTKRNLALLLSHMLRWKRVVFLDDDIRVPNPGDLCKAVSLLDAHSAVGLGIGGYPDNSTVCHAFREAGGWQETFIGGGALAVEIKRNCTFFPNVYNEDWFFVLDAGKGMQSVATVGEVLQDAYDPYRPARARAEELGDVLAEGTFWLLDQGRSVSDGDLAHWRNFLARRKRFIEQVQSMVEFAPAIESPERARMAVALEAALDRLKEITPDLCVDYLKALVTDQDRWQRHIQAVRKQKKLRREVALDSLARDIGGPLMWCTMNEKWPHRSGTARGRRPRVMVPRWRRVQPDELQAAIPSPPPALVPRVVTAARRALPLRPRTGVPSSHPAHALVTTKIVLPGDQGQAEGNDHGDKRPSQHLHP